MKLKVLAVVALLVLAGCTVPRLPFSTADPPSDRLGWEDGYWYDESLGINDSDGLNASERETVVARAMARIERIRQLEFNATVPVEVITREEYRRRNNGSGNTTDRQLWNDQVWEALFIVGERTDAADSFSSTLGASIQGYYSASEDEIVIVSDSATPTVSRATLAHELVHALQDQQGWLNGSADTQDRQLARNGIVEGDANFVMSTYTSRCGEQWDCISTPDGGGGGGGGGYNRGLFLTIYQPYATGPGFVAALKRRGGWSAVNDAYSDIPDSSEQVIHPSLYPDEKPVNVSVPDRSNDQWDRFDVSPVADTVGEASIYAMFVSNDVVQPRDRYGYNATESAGWGGDALVPYRNDGEYGYVWTTVWDTEADAEEFETAYVDLLEGRNATERRGGVYVIGDEDPYGDAFRITREGDRVRVVNAPTVADLDGIHAA